MNESTSSIVKNIQAFILSLCLVTVIFHSWDSSVYAYDTSNSGKSQSFWGNVGVGGSSFGLSGGISFSYQTGKELISIRFVYNEEVLILGPSPSESIWDVGALYGRAIKASYGLASLSGGISMVGGVRRGRYLHSGSGLLGGDYYEKLPFYTVGIPIESQLFLIPFSSFGIGLYGFANLNPKKSFVGALLSVQIGKLK